MKLTVSNIHWNKIEKEGLITLLLLFFTYIYLFFSFSYPPFYEFLVLINSTICIWNIVNIRHQPYSLRMMVNIFVYIFFILANAIQFGNHNNVLTFHYELTTFDFCLFQFVLFFILCIFNGLYVLTKSIQTQQQPILYFKRKKSLTISLFTTFLILLYFRFNPYALLLRGFVSDMMVSLASEDSVGAGPLQLIFDHFIRPIPWAIYLCSIIVGNKNKRDNLILFFCALITVFPTGLARNAAAMYWIPIFILYFRNRIKGRTFVWIIFLGLFFVFPFLDNFRNFDGNIKFSGGLDYLNNMNFDASQIFMTVISTGLITFGKQLLGVFLFFFPRSLWADKPIGSGAFLVDQMGGGFSNVSMPYFAEGYLNFGYIGILFFVIILAIGCKKLDSFYWNSKDYGGISQGYYLILLSAIIFILRGDLLNGFAYTLGLIVCYFVTIKLTLSRF